MEKIELKVSIEAIRLDALQFYLSSKENTTPQKALEKMLTEIYVPDIMLQKQFTDFVKQTDKSKVVVQKALDEAQTLFDSLMQEYFG